MKTICFYFQIHQPFRLKRYRFFDIGGDHYYYDDFNNEEIIRRLAEQSYLRANETLLQMIESSGGKFKVAFSISGVALEQLEIYVPEFIDSMKKLVKTGCVEFLSETYAHSLSSLSDADEFERQVEAHSKKIQQLFGQTPKVFRNTELIYNDDIADLVAGMGFKGMITEGAKHILGWKSPNYVYRAANQPELKLLLKNSKLSDDIALRFSNYEWTEYPLTAEKYVRWIADLPSEEQLVNLFMNYDVLGHFQPAESGIFNFLKALPRFAAEAGISFSTPSEILGLFKASDKLTVIHPISWMDEERDTTAWLGNVLQNEAFNKLYSIAERVNLCDDRRLKQDWNYLQSSDHFYYMSTKHYSTGRYFDYKAFSPYESPYDAFTNYMNVLSDFMVRVEAQYPTSIDNEELNALLTTIRNQSQEIELLNQELRQTKAILVKEQETSIKKSEKPTSKKVAKTVDTPAKKTKKTESK